ncbi:hypothetical protein D3C81_822000 [compost metagenome]
MSADVPALSLLQEKSWLPIPFQNRHSDNAKPGAAMAAGASAYGYMSMFFRYKRLSG